MADKYSMTLMMRIDKVGENGERTSTGHEIDSFHSMPTDLETALKGWYLTLQHLSGCCGDGDIADKASQLLVDD